MEASGHEAIAAAVTRFLRENEDLLAEHYPEFNFEKMGAFYLGNWMADFSQLLDPLALEKVVGGIKADMFDPLANLCESLSIYGIDLADSLLRWLQTQRDNLKDLSREADESYLPKPAMKTAIWIREKGLDLSNIDGVALTAGAMASRLHYTASDIRKVQGSFVAALGMAPSADVTEADVRANRVALRAILSRLMTAVLRLMAYMKFAERVGDDNKAESEESPETHLPAHRVWEAFDAVVGIYYPHQHLDRTLSRKTDLKDYFKERQTHIKPYKAAVDADRAARRADAAAALKSFEPAEEDAGKTKDYSGRLINLKAAREQRIARTDPNSTLKKAERALEIFNLSHYDSRLPRRDDRKQLTYTYLDEYLQIVAGKLADHELQLKHGQSKFHKVSKSRPNDSQAVQEGRTDAFLARLGNTLHAVEDYFAHTNAIDRVMGTAPEIARHNKLTGKELEKVWQATRRYNPSTNPTASFADDDVMTDSHIASGYFGDSDVAVSIFHLLHGKLGHQHHFHILGEGESATIAHYRDVAKTYVTALEKLQAGRKKAEAEGTPRTGTGNFSNTAEDARSYILALIEDVLPAVMGYDKAAVIKAGQTKIGTRSTTLMGEIVTAAVMVLNVRALAKNTAESLETGSDLDQGGVIAGLVPFYNYIDVLLDLSRVILEVLEVAAFLEQIREFLRDPKGYLLGMVTDVLRQSLDQLISDYLNQLVKYISNWAKGQLDIRLGSHSAIAKDDSMDQFRLNSIALTCAIAVDKEIISRMFLNPDEGNDWHAVCDAIFLTGKRNPVTPFTGWIKIDRNRSYAQLVADPTHIVALPLPPKGVSLFDHLANHRVFTNANPGVTPDLLYERVRDLNGLSPVMLRQPLLPRPGLSLSPGWTHWLSQPEFDQRDTDLLFLGNSLLVPHMSAAYVRLKTLPKNSSFAGSILLPELIRYSSWLEQGLSGLPPFRFFTSNPIQDNRIEHVLEHLRTSLSENGFETASRGDLIRQARRGRSLARRHRDFFDAFIKMSLDG